MPNAITFFPVPAIIAVFLALAPTSSPSLLQQKQKPALLLNISSFKHVEITIFQ